MNIIKSIFVISAIALIGCKSSQPSENDSKKTEKEEMEVADQAHNSQNSLDWMGIYTGILPCADCSGIQVSITLNEDNTFEKSTVYLDKTNEKQEENGSFDWQEDGNSIVLNDQNDEVITYKVEENQLRMLDQKGQKIEGDLAENYILQKATSPIVNKYWKATEIMGQKIEVSENMNREPHLIIRSNGEFSAGGGCNTIFGKFELEGAVGISFSNIGMTQKACSFDNVDQQLAEALDLSRQFIMTDDEQMQLIVGKRAPLAKFEVVYF